MSETMPETESYSNIHRLASLGAKGARSSLRAGASEAR